MGIHTLMVISIYLAEWLSGVFQLDSRHFEYRHYSLRRLEDNSGAGYDEELLFCLQVIALRLV